jgi:hypothetical protein
MEFRPPQLARREGWVGEKGQKRRVVSLMGEGRLRDRLIDRNSLSPALLKDGERLRPQLARCTPAASPFDPRIAAVRLVNERGVSQHVQQSKAKRLAHCVCGSVFTQHTLDPLCLKAVRLQEIQSAFMEQ